MMYPISFTPKGTAGAAFFGMVITMALNFLIGALTWTWLLNTALVMVGKHAVVAWWQGGLIGMVPGFGYIGIIGCIALWLFTLFF